MTHFFCVLKSRQAQVEKEKKIFIMRQDCSPEQQLDSKSVAYLSTDVILNCLKMMYCLWRGFQGEENGVKIVLPLITPRVSGSQL